MKKDSERAVDIAPGEDWVKRRAKLFEVGDYPDKGVSITTAHLEMLAENFGEPVPVLIEHAKSPLELGLLTSVVVEGDELFGEVELSKEANALIEKSGAKSLSLGLSARLDRIKEVSLVKNPRVQSAQIFTNTLFFVSQLEPSVDFKSRCAELEGQLAEREAVDLIDQYVRQGKLTPAQVPFARALAVQCNAIQFGDSEQSVRDLLMAILDRQAPHTLFEQMAPTSDADADANLLLPEEAEFYRKHFPNIALGEIAQRKRATN
ncbi:MAG: hypothetical protein JNM04_01500 [Chthonomonas sp.]|nr:hypothetical protein [Chthonomonas sp.]